MKTEKKIYITEVMTKRQDRLPSPPVFSLH